jgi:dephospho-CoA kinase
MNIAITGTIGSGKSGVASALAGFMRVQCIDTDLLCRQLLQPGAAGQQQVADRWGSRFSGPDGALDRVALREAVFAEPQIRKELEGILHPEVLKIVRERMAEAAAGNEHLLVEIPLLYEVGWESDFDHVVAVYADPRSCVERTVARDRVASAQVESIMALQLSGEEKAARADSVINNSGIWSATILQVSLLARNLRRLGLG